jgi:hypothetical protein
MYPGLPVAFWHLPTTNLSWYSADPAQEALDHPLITPLFAAADDVAAEPVLLLR